MKLFIEYQIPPDLLSYSPSTNETTASTELTGGAIAPIDAVRHNVKEIMNIINESKEKEIQEQLQKTVKNVLDEPDMVYAQRNMMVSAGGPARRSRLRPHGPQETKKQAVPRRSQQAHAPTGTCRLPAAGQQPMKTR